MKHGSNRRLANVKTRSETGLDYVMSADRSQHSFWQNYPEGHETFFSGRGRGAAT